MNWVILEGATEVEGNEGSGLNVQILALAASCQRAAE